jgi:biopolymer transport protein ExbD
MLALEATEESAAILPDLTALLDILFIVLVFLLLSIATPVDMLEVSLPEAGEVDTTQLDSKTLMISLAYQPLAGNEAANKKISYGLAKKQYSSLALLLIALKNQPDSNDQKVKLMLAIDKKAPSEALIELLAVLSRQGYAVANILIDKTS